MSLLERPLADIARAVETGAARPTALVEEAIERHLHRDVRFGAYRTFDPEHARAQARAVEARRTRGQPGFFDGMPVSAKDLYGVDGLPTFAGTTRRLPAEWEREGFLISTLRAQGAVVIGKTHTVELAFGGAGLNPVAGTPANPWDAGVHRLPGGSSSGAGVSLAEGSAVIALGTDTGGSIRIPAALTGVVGQKLTQGRWSTDGVVPLSATLDTVGALTRSVADQIHVFGAVDPACEGPLGLERALAGTSVRGLRIGVPSSTVWEEAEAGVVAVVRGALAELEAAGARLIDLDGAPFDDASRAYLESGLVAAECAAFLDDRLVGWWPLLHPIVGARVAPGRDVTADAIERIRTERVAAAQRARVWMAEVDAVAVPAVPFTAPPVASVQTLDAYVPVNRASLRATTPASWLGLCALSQPAGLDAQGLPVGLQWIAGGGDDVRLLGLVRAVEGVLGTPRERLGEPPRGV